jgi:hypothetical protein
MIFLFIILNSSFLIWIGGVAQLGERLPCTQEVIGSIPFTSTIKLIQNSEFRIQNYREAMAASSLRP